MLSCTVYHHLEYVPLIIFDIWLTTACSPGFKWEKSSPGSSLSVSSHLAKVSSDSLLVDCKILASTFELLNCLVLFLLVNDRLEGSEAFRSRLLVMSKVLLFLLQVGFNLVYSKLLVVEPMLLVESNVLCCLQLLGSKIGKGFLSSGLLGNESCRTPS